LGCLLDIGLEAGLEFLKDACAGLLIADLVHPLNEEQLLPQQYPIKIIEMDFEDLVDGQQGLLAFLPVAEYVVQVQVRGVVQVCL
jgi:hypothetical protein